MIVKGPYCFGCEGTNVVDRYFWGHVGWTSNGPIEGSVKLPVCLDCDGDIGSKYPVLEEKSKPS